MNKSIPTKIVASGLLLLGAYNAHADWWEWTEDNWKGKANVVEGQTFTMVFMKPSTGETATAPATFTRKEGKAFVINRQAATDANNRACDYSGELSADGKKFGGRYICNPGASNFPFSGRVLGPNDVPSFVVCEVSWHIGPPLSSDKTFVGFGADKNAALNIAKTNCSKGFPASDSGTYCLTSPVAERCN